MPVLLDGWFVIQGREVCNHYAVLRMKRNLHNSWYTCPKTWLTLLTYQTNERRLGVFQLQVIINELRVKPVIQGRSVLKDTRVLACFWCFTLPPSSLRGSVLFLVLSHSFFYICDIIIIFFPVVGVIKFSLWTDYSNTDVTCLYLCHCLWLKK